MPAHKKPHSKKKHEKECKDEVDALLQELEQKETAHEEAEEAGAEEREELDREEE